MKVQPTSFLSRRNDIQIGAWLTALSMSLTIGSPVDAYTYVIDRSFNEATVKGFLETDGTLGVITSKNITRFDVSAYLEPRYPLRFTSENGAYVATRNAATFADLSSISFNFNVPNGQFIIESEYGAYRFSMNEETYVNTVEFASVERVGLVQFASAAGGAVPEPATWAIMLLGFAAIGCTLRAAPRHGERRPVREHGSSMLRLARMHDQSAP